MKLFEYRTVRIVDRQLRCYHGCLPLIGTTIASHVVCRSILLWNRINRGRNMANGWEEEEEGGEWCEENGRTDAVDDRTTFVYPLAKPLPEFIIICSTTGAVCGLRPRGTRPL